MNDDQMVLVFEWIDSIPLSREKKNINRDFCDGLLLAEIIKYYHPKLVEVHNYPSASSTKQKLSNWNTLNLKVLKKIKLSITQDEILDIINCKPKVIEKLLLRLYYILVKKDTTTANSNNLFTKASPHKEAIKLKESIHIIQNEINELTNKKQFLLKSIEQLNEESENFQQRINELKQKGNIH